jgi:lipopolysaccharide/colanic/teichoic acid biosynthesis glycosyltransferase
MSITAIALKLEDPNAPIIFRNKRVGLKGQSFFLYKFRYMKNEFCVDEENPKALEYEKELIKKQSNRAWPLYKIKDDPRKTKVWTFIEKYSIDELPQLFNVILGNMSLVWPRPHQPREVDKYELYQRRVFTVKPWITGMAQINGREKNTFDKEVKLDIFYIENWSLLLDIKIIYKTFPILFQR